MEQLKKYQEIGNLIREDIFSGSYQIGDRYKSERDIAEQYQVSRTVVRESFVMLEIEGIVQVRKGSGIFIQRTQPAQDTQPVDQIEDVGPFELLQARQLVESQVAELAAKNVTKADIIKLRRLLQEEREFVASGAANMANEQSSIDNEIHFAIAEATQNVALADLVRRLRTRSSRSPMWDQLHSRIDNQDYCAKWQSDHEAIVMALVKKDPDAARQAMWQHLENVKATLMELSDVDNPEFDGYLFA